MCRVPWVLALTKLSPSSVHHQSCATTLNNLGFHSLLRWNMIILQILSTSLSRECSFFHLGVKWLKETMWPCVKANKSCAMHENKIMNRSRYHQQWRMTWILIKTYVIYILLLQITAKMRRSLRSLGYCEQEINAMNPGSAQQILQGSSKKV